ncbi:fucosyltransferase 6 [Selaginella moellendorffii]|nr:fucosyltransferase 6 [Selaginella moellendorffii]|eukprot:XP_002989072.2 fucosyltransferase 6 [Selaginella moellendorffii]
MDAMPFVKIFLNLKLLKVVLVVLLFTSLLVPTLVIRNLSFAHKSSKDCLRLGKRAQFVINPPISNSPNARTCLSREFQQNLWKEVHTIPAPLSKALREYEKMHERCYLGRNLTQAILHPDPRDHCRYLVHAEADGLGNRLLTLATAFMYSLLTNRVFLVDRRGHLSKLLCEPFNHSWLLPEDFPYHLIDKAPKLGTINNSELGNIVRLFLVNAETGDQRFFCPETRSDLEDVPWIIWASNLYYVPRLFTFPEFWMRLTIWFPDVSLTFTQLSKYLLLPQNHVWHKITRLRSSYLSTPGKQLGMQVRLHHRGDPAVFHRPSLERILQCLTENKLLSSVVNADFAKNNSIRYEEPKKPIKVMVTSLQVKYYEELKNNFMNYPTADGRLIEVHTFSSDGVQTDSLEQAVNAMVEIWLLSTSDVFVSSSCSTFGYVAQALAGLRPYILNIQGDDLENCELTACSVGQSSDPCNHYPFFRDCEDLEKTKAHFEWEKIHIKGCQDEWEGIQLA